MLRTIYGDAARYRKTYWSEIAGCYFAGDGARRDKDGYFWIVGRIDDVLNVAGHRLVHGGDRKRPWWPTRPSRRPRSSRSPTR
jgi:acyl-coenzyme A synthetase/AMP-(fatty) acid ligase